MGKRNREKKKKKTKFYPHRNLLPGMFTVEADFRMAEPDDRLLQTKEKSHWKNAGPQGTEDPSMLKSVNISYRKVEWKEFRVE